MPSTEDCWRKRRDLCVDQDSASSGSHKNHRAGQSARHGIAAASRRAGVKSVSNEAGGLGNTGGWKAVAVNTG